MPEEISGSSFLRMTVQEPARWQKLTVAKKSSPMFLPSALQTSAMFLNHADALRIFKSARFVS